MDAYQSQKNGYPFSHAIPCSATEARNGVVGTSLPPPVEVQRVIGLYCAPTVHVWTDLGWYTPYCAFCGMINGES